MSGFGPCLVELRVRLTLPLPLPEPAGAEALSDRQTGADRPDPLGLEPPSPQTQDHARFVFLHLKFSRPFGNLEKSSWVGLQSALPQ